jgi:hypothetical protein
MGAHDRLIDRLFEEKDIRATVRAMVSALPSTMHEDRVVALVHQLAAPVPDGQTPEQSAAFITSFIGAIGGMEHEQQAFARWVDAGGPGSPVFEEAAAEPPAAEPAPVAASVAPGPDRATAAKADIARFETMMRDEPSAYWRSTTNQSAYHDALAVLHGGESSNT